MSDLWAWFCYEPPMRSQASFLISYGFRVLLWQMMILPPPHPMSQDCGVEETPRAEEVGNTEYSTEARGHRQGLPFCIFLPLHGATLHLCL